MAVTAMLADETETANLHEGELLVSAAKYHYYGPSSGLMLEGCRIISE